MAKTKRRKTKRKVSKSGLTQQDRKVLRMISNWRSRKQSKEIAKWAALTHDSSSVDPTLANITKKVELPKKKTQAVIQKLKRKGLVRKDMNSSIGGYVWYSWYPKRRKK